MSGTAELLAFAGVMALGQFSPGPDMMLLTRTALKSGARKGVEMALGIACGLTVHATVALTGVAVLLENRSVFREVLRWAAAAYLLWLANRILKALFLGWRGGTTAATSAETLGRRPFLRGLFCNLLNPKAAIFLAAASAPFLRGPRPEWWPVAIWGIVVGQGFLLWSWWAWVLQWKPLRQRYVQAERWIDGVFGMVLLALAIRLILG